VRARSINLTLPRDTRLQVSRSPYGIPPAVIENKLRRWLTPPERARKRNYKEGARVLD
jgi:hypothetical protein